jgi:toxin HigB-1
MIKSFHSGALKRLWEDGREKGIDPMSLLKIQRILAHLNVVCDPSEMNMPGYRFHALVGDRAGTYAVTVRANWRITFEWEGGHVVCVDIEDYHGS